MKVAPLIIAICLCAVYTRAQNTYSVKGVTVDTSSKAKLTTTITVLNAKDSILRKFTHSKTDGSFSISGLTAGTYLIWVSYPDYAAYEEKFTLNPASNQHDFGNISMRLKSRVLQDVIIKGEAVAVKIKGDTTEFNAKAYVIQPNDKVEDLLRQLPGIQVDHDGKITAQGETVTKVLLDGEEFFGDDPLLITRNIRADMVDKVQLYNKKTDQATFTGIDDGKTTKTINIVLKEDRKTGVFGKVDAGIGDDGYYEGQAIYNKFKAKYKFAAYGTASNDGKNNLGAADNSKIGTSSSVVTLTDDGGYSVSFSRGDELDNGTYSGRGLPSARTGGVHYDGKFDDDKITINTNYKIGELALTTDQTTFTQQNIPGGNVQNTDAVQDSYAHTFRQKADVTYQKTIDPTANLKIAVDATLKTTENDNTGFTTVTDGTGALLNHNNQTDNTNGTLKTFDISFIYNKKFKKARRTISWNVSETYNEGTSTEYLKSDIFTQVNAKDTVTNQYKPSNITSSVLNSNLVYTEPLTKLLSLSVNYGLGFNNSSSDKDSYDQSAPGVYNVFDATFSNYYKFNVLTNQLGANFNYAYSTKGSLIFGTKASAVDFTQADQYTGLVYKRNFVDWTPQVTFRYRMANSGNYMFTYSGSNSQPSITQIQPVRDNTNPENVLVGNANLEASFRNTFSTSYTSINQLTGQLFAVSGNYSFTTNSIISNSTFNTTTGKTTTQYVNLLTADPYNFNVNSQLNPKIFGVRIDFILSVNGSATYAYSDNLLSKTTSNGLTGNITYRKNVAKKYNIQIGAGPNYTFSSNSLQSTGNYNYPGLNSTATGTVYLPGKFQLTTELRYRYQGAISNQPAVYNKLWNAGINKTFFKEDNLMLSLTGTNLLNQDQNTRNVNALGFTQTSVNTIKRFFMLAVSWDFTKFGTIAVKN